MPEILHGRKIQILLMLYLEYVRLHNYPDGKDAFFVDVMALADALM
jgi:hypothetical protein